MMHYSVCLYCLQIEKANWKLEEIELFELNEAFAAQSLSVIKELGLDPNKVLFCCVSVYI